MARVILITYSVFTGISDEHRWHWNRCEKFKCQIIACLSFNFWYFFCSFFTATTINGFSLCLFYYGAYLHFIKITISCLPIPHFVCKNYEIKIHELLLPYAWSLSVVITVNEILRIFSIATFRISDSSNRHLIFTCHVLFGKRLNDRIENRIGSTPELTSEHSSSGKY